MDRAPIGNKNAEYSAFKISQILQVQISVFELESFDIHQEYCHEFARLPLKGILR